MQVEALADDEVVEGPVYVTINVLDVNNNAPYFNQSDYTATIRENRPAGVWYVNAYKGGEQLLILTTANCEVLWFYSASTSKALVSEDMQSQATAVPDEVSPTCRMFVFF